MLSVEKQYAVGSVVSWQTGDSVRSGTIEAVHKTAVDKDADPSGDALDASVDDPAYQIVATNGDTVIKRHTQLLKTDPSFD